MRHNIEVGKPQVRWLWLFLIFGFVCWTV